MVATQDTDRMCYLDELFMALLGHTGDLFQRQEAEVHMEGSVPLPFNCSFRTADNLHFISESDRIILDGLLRLGFHCCALRAYVKLEEFAWSRKGCSHYRCALSHGVSELLEVYSSAILQLQLHLETDQFPSLSTIRYFLSDFAVVLPSIHEIVYQVHIEGLKGAQVLRLLHQKATTGAMEVQSCLERLSWHCYQIFFEHLKAWIQHGLLLDKSGEFLVQESDWAEASSKTMTGGSAHAKEWRGRFQVVSDLIPPEISEQTAENILFVGKAVRALRPECDRLSTEHLDDFELLQGFEDAKSFNARLFEHFIETVKQKAAEKLCSLIRQEGDLMSHLRALRDYFLLGRGDFWQDFLLESHTLMSYPAVQATALANITAPFLQSASMTSAEEDPLFSRFSIALPQPSRPDAVPSSMSGNTTAQRSQRSAAVETPYMSLPSSGATQKATSQDSTPSQYFSARESVQTRAAEPTKRTESTISTLDTKANAGKVGVAKKGMKVPDYDPAWDPLTLEYNVEWPLHLILSPEVILNYSRMFQYLFRLERMQLELKRCWSTMNSRGTCKRDSPPFQVQQEPQPPKELPPMWQVRSHMAHLISNLQLYIQVDVIEVQYEEMKSKMSKIKTLEELEQIHEDFLSACIVQSCLDVPMFASLLTKTLALCRSFCTQVQGLGKGTTRSEYPKVLVEEFQRNSKLMYRLLSTPAMQSRARAPFLRLLLLRLNFNDFVQQEALRYNIAQAPRS